MGKAEELFNLLPGYKDDLVEHINDMPLDIIEKVPAEEFAMQVIKIAQRIAIFMEKRPQMKIHGVIGNVDKGIIWNVYVQNWQGGSVSVNTDTETGASRTLYLPFYEDEDEGWLCGLNNLADMINEAWYHCEND